MNWRRNECLIACDLPCGCERREHEERWDRYIISSDCIIGLPHEVACRAIVDLVKRHRITSFANVDIRKPRAPLSFRRVISISPSSLGWNVLKAVSATGAS